MVLRCWRICMIYLLPLLFYCWFPPECFWSQLLHYSLLIDSFLFLLGPCKTFLASSQSLSLGYLSVMPVCFQDFGSFLLSLFRILFQVDSLSPPLLFGLVGIYHVPLPTEYFSAFSTCLLCLGWSFSILAVCGSSLLWRFLTGVVVGRVACWGFLVREACVGVLVGGAGFLLTRAQWSVQ